jgi:GNAT superfamily N-acetyltransferase
MAASSKFAGIDFSQIKIEKLTPDLDIPGQGFRCTRREFVTYWRQGRVQREVNALISQCWIIRVDDALAGYITLLADKLKVDEQILIEEGVQYRTFPTIKIGLLADDQRAKGAGRRMVKWALGYIATEIAPIVGVRFVTVDALYDSDLNPPYDASGFYQKFGFEFAEPDEEILPSTLYRTMYFDLKPLIEQLNEDLDN